MIYLNQYAGPLFRELVDDLVQEFGPGELYTGHVEEIERKISPDIKLISSPGQNTAGNLARILSWLRYCTFVFFKISNKRGGGNLFIVSNPPILPWLGYLFHKLWGWKYVVLVYDIYPEMLIGFSGFSSSGPVARAWYFLNRLAFENAEAVITIGKYMARTLDRMYDSNKTCARETVVIPNWADPDIIRPIQKSKNPFAKKYAQLDCLTILYSGTIGIKHNISAMLQAAIKLNRNINDVHFIFIGRGDGFNSISKVIEMNKLENTTLLPFLPENQLVFSLASGDVAVVALENAGQGVYVPSKTYYALAAGSAILALCDQENELADIVKSYHCGLTVQSDDIEGFIAALHRFRDDRQFLDTCRQNARIAAETLFSRRNCTQIYKQILRKINFGEERRDI
ncbi:glycosyltransferase family 4 protein [Candidatus Villigracilis saccharophilus]|uniref:glycosyltransferase family 4 protein n=1 Tax=Candidatus Villigracilis saccharophilus TaxID=3140684 RepID=UPI003136BAC4|nr:glycosyltransferase family 4 protein [Anaerolineales bacterium]